MSDMDRLTWIIAGILSAIVLMVVLTVSFSGKGREAAALQSKLTEAEAALAKARAAAGQHETELAELKTKLTQAEERIAQLQQERDFAAQSQRSLEDEMRAALESKDVTISQLQGKLTVSILDRVLFDSGEAQLRPEGEAVLRKVAAFLTAHPRLKVHVIGHTDNVPIKATARSRFPSNWELSSARANAAVRFLAEQAGIDPRRLGAVGYGEFRPVADNSTPEGRARNRRIAITVLSDELVGADATPPKAVAAPAPAPVPVKLPEHTGPPND
jgi:chemotaxis protein MotB